MDFDTKVLMNSAVDVTDIVELSNIGEIGMSPDFSQNQLANDLQNEFPLFHWLMNTSASRRIRGAFNEGRAMITRDEKQELNLVLPFEVGTTPPTDTNGECCWTPLELSKCGSKAPLKLLCLKDCDKILENFVWSKKRFGSNDMTGYFAHKGETVKQARDRMAKLSMAYFTPINVINGTSTTGTAFLKPFHGLLEVMEDKAVIKILGTNILAAFDSLGCRLSVAGTSNEIAYWVHPLVYNAIDEAVVPGKFNGELPKGWARNGGSLTFMGHPVKADKLVPVDATKGVGDIWVLDGKLVGAYLGTSLIPEEKYIRRTFGEQNQTSGCGNECTFYYNFGTAFRLGANSLAVITDVPLSANCMGQTLNGLDSLIKPNTLVPMNKKA